MALVAIDQTSDMSALQPQTTFQSITPRAGRYAVQLVERLGEVSPGLGECAAPTCTGGCGSVRRHSFGEPLALLVVRANQRPIRVITTPLDHDVGDASMQAAGHAGRRELRGDLS